MHLIFATFSAPVDDWNSNSELAFPDDGKHSNFECTQKTLKMSIFQVVTINTNTTTRESRL